MIIVAYILAFVALLLNASLFPRLGRFPASVPSHIYVDAGGGPEFHRIRLAPVAS